MDLSLQYDKYILKSKDEAYASFCDDKNKKAHNFILWGLTIIFGIVFLVSAIADREDIPTAIFYTIVFLVFLFVRIFFKKIFSSGKTRKRIITLFLFLLIFFTLFKVLDNLFFDKGSYDITLRGNEKGITIQDKNSNEEVKHNDSSYLTIAIMFSLFLLTLRLSKTEYIQLYTLSYGIPFIPEILINSKIGIPAIIAMTAVVLILYTISVTRESKFRKTFEKQYDYFVKKHSESLRMKKELNYAREIQVSMLPETPVSIGGIKIMGLSEPAKEVGGDYFDYFRISEKETGIFICDVSGHGVASGLLLSGLRAGIHLILEDTVNPKIVFEKLNRMIRKTQSRKMFVTAILAIVNTETKKCSLFNAGHLPPYKIDGKTLEVLKLKRHGITLGAMDEIAPENEDTEIVFDFAESDKIIFYTDGVSEAMDREKNEYGFDRLEQFLYANADKEIEELAESLKNDINTFTKNCERNDDLTILIIKAEKN